MRIKLTSVFVDDQAKALKFYTEVLGFVKKADMPAGEARWLTVVSPEGPDDLELLLEPNGNPAAMAYQKAIHDQGIPATVFYAGDVQAEYERMKRLGVAFRSEPVKEQWGTSVVFDDTCGNLIMLAQM
ncbi:MAG: VOC family protein [Anaerolineae bacterium]